MADEKDQDIAPQEPAPPAPQEDGPAEQAQGAPALAPEAPPAKQQADEIPKGSVDAKPDLVPGKIDLGNAISASPTEAVQKSASVMSDLQRSGVDLAKWMLTIIAGALVVLTLLVGSAEIWPTSEISHVHQIVLQLHEKTSALKADDPSLPAVRKDMIELTRQIVDSKQAQRSFWIQFAQMILLNLLLPVLTAILGYVFGANSNKS